MSLAVRRSARRPRCPFFGGPGFWRLLDGGGHDCPAYCSGHPRCLPRPVPAGQAWCGPSDAAGQSAGPAGCGVRVRPDRRSCHDELRQTVFFEPPHHSGHQPLGGWVTGPGPPP